MPRYRNGFADVEAVQWTGSMSPVIALVGQDLPTYGAPGQSGSIRVPTGDDDDECRLNDWIVRSGNGDLLRVDPAVFAATYEAVDE